MKQKKNELISVKKRSSATWCLLCCAMVFSGFLPVSAEPTVYENGSSYEIVDTVLKIMVPEGKTNDVVGAELSSLQDNTLKSVEKYGRGALVMNVDLTAYEGDIYVKEGTWRVVDSTGLGKLSKTSKAEDVGKVYVSDGATLEAKCTAAPVYRGKSIHVSGYGVDGNGALLVSGDITSYGSTTWGSNLVLEGDTYANSITKAYWYYNTSYYANGGWITFNGHDFIVSGGTSKSPFVVFSRVNNTDLGRVVLTNNAILSFQGFNNLTRINGNTGTIVVTPGSRINGNSWSGRMEWDVVWNTTSYLTPAKYSTAVDVPVTNRCSFHGAVDVAQILKATVSDGGGLGFFGPITGQGEIEISNTSDIPPTNQVWIANGENSFEGNVNCNNVCLMVPENGALPMTATLQLTDCLINFTNKNYALPDITFTNTKDCVVSGGCGKWKTFIKTGSGTVDYDSSIGAEVLDLRQGVLKVFPMQQWVFAGLIEGVEYFDDANTSRNAAKNAEIAYTNGVVMSPYLMNSELKTYWTTFRPDWDVESQTIKGNCTTYTGYMWNRESTNVMWTFVSCVANVTTLHIDGMQLFSHQPTTSARTLGNATIEVTPGAHRFRIGNHSQYHSNNMLKTEGGMSGSVAEWKGMGLRWDPLGRGTTNHENFVVLEDPGDGSLFTWAIPGEDVFYPGTEELIKHIKFNLVKFTGGTLHLNGVTNSITDAEGIPLVAGTGKLIIENAWTIDAADIADGSAVSGLSFGFGADAELEIENSSAAKSMTGTREWTVIKSAEDITGSITVKDEDMAKRWSVKVDGNEVKLKYRPFGTAVIIR